MAKGIKTGGRRKGTPNRDNPIKGYLRSHSLAYFEPRLQTEPDGSPRKIVFTDKEGSKIDTITLCNPDGSPRLMSDFDVDMLMLDTSDRVLAELRLLKFHTPEMKAVEVDMTPGTTITIESRLRQLCGQPPLPDDSDTE